MLKHKYNGRHKIIKVQPRKPLIAVTKRAADSSTEDTENYNKEIDFKQEMRGTAEIITEDLRLFERFFYQFKQLLDR